MTKLRGGCSQPARPVTAHLILGFRGFRFGARGTRWTFVSDSSSLINQAHDATTPPSQLSITSFPTPHYSTHPRSAASRLSFPDKHELSPSTWPAIVNMGLLSFFRSVYDLDTLDTRFTNSSTVPYQTVIDARSDPVTIREPPRRSQRAEPPKWRTPEFYFYYVIFLIAVPYMFWVPFEVSRRTILAASSA